MLVESDTHIMISMDLYYHVPSYRIGIDGSPHEDYRRDPFPTVQDQPQEPRDLCIEIPDDVDHLLVF